MNCGTSRADGSSLSAVNRTQASIQHHSAWAERIGLLEDQLEEALSSFRRDKVKLMGENIELQRNLKELLREQERLRRLRHDLPVCCDTALPGDVVRGKNLETHEVSQDCRAKLEKCYAELHELSRQLSHLAPEQSAVPESGAIPAAVSDRNFDLPIDCARLQSATAELESEVSNLSLLKHRSDMKEKKSQQQASHLALENELLMKKVMQLEQDIRDRDQKIRTLLNTEEPPNEEYWPLGDEDTTTLHKHINGLERRVETLERENERLEKLLAENGITSFDASSASFREVDPMTLHDRYKRCLRYTEHLQRLLGAKRDEMQAERSPCKSTGRLGRHTQSTVLPTKRRPNTMRKKRTSSSNSRMTKGSTMSYSEEQRLRRASSATFRAAVLSSSKREALPHPPFK
ncbi:hypothetical protein FOL47_005617 [Perkinsus chesapeaki]|uniref:Uncharacterized protein n=1 Tax=Perkinsus chesapeaki TaxID=330153 RepID=A0A7J6MYX1_PERCH|nr:hypothetical protein FOL47_005617 [Perkinsus chesapeaki]